jgi:hypothetical protein
MKEILGLFLAITFAVNSYASPLIFKGPKEVKWSKYAKSEFYTEIKKINQKGDLDRYRAVNPTSFEFKQGGRRKILR